MAEAMTIQPDYEQNSERNYVNQSTKYPLQKGREGISKGNATNFLMNRTKDQDNEPQCVIHEAKTAKIFERN